MSKNVNNDVSKDPPIAGAIKKLSNACEEIVRGLFLVFLDVKLKQKWNVDIFASL